MLYLNCINQRIDRQMIVDTKMIASLPGKHNIIIIVYLYNIYKCLRIISAGIIILWTFIYAC